MQQDMQESRRNLQMEMERVKEESLADLAGKELFSHWKLLKGQVFPAQVKRTGVKGDYFRRAGKEAKLYKIGG